MTRDLIVLPHRINIAVTYSLFIHEIVSQKMYTATHLLLIMRVSPVANMLYHSQTDFVMNSFWGIQLLWCDIPTVVKTSNLLVARLDCDWHLFHCVPYWRLSDFNKQNTNVTYILLIMGLKYLMEGTYGTHNLAKYTTMSLVLFYATLNQNPLLWQPVLSSMFPTHGTDLFVKHTQ